MHVTLTPNVAEVVRADPMLELVITELRRGPHGGYLHLFRSRKTGPFDAVYNRNGERYATSDRDLMAAIYRATADAA